MTTDELLRLARIVYPGKDLGVNQASGCLEEWGETGPFLDLGWSVFDFNPSLTGEDWQVAQACRVIVAAFNLPGFLCTEIYGDNFMTSIKTGGGPIRTYDGCDILQASSHALLQTLPGGG